MTKGDMVGFVFKLRELSHVSHIIKFIPHLYNFGAILNAVTSLIMFSNQSLHIFLRFFLLGLHCLFLLISLT